MLRVSRPAPDGTRRSADVRIVGRRTFAPVARLSIWANGAFFQGRLGGLTSIPRLRSIGPAPRWRCCAPSGCHAGDRSRGRPVDHPCGLLSRCACARAAPTAICHERQDQDRRCSRARKGWSTGGLGDRSPAWQPEGAQHRHRGARPDPISSAGYSSIRPTCPGRTRRCPDAQSRHGAKVRLANDADMAALGEFHRGAGRGNPQHGLHSRGRRGRRRTHHRRQLPSRRARDRRRGRAHHHRPQRPARQLRPARLPRGVLRRSQPRRETGHRPPSSSPPPPVARHTRGWRRAVGPLHGARADQPDQRHRPGDVRHGWGVTRSWKLVAPTMLETLRSSPFIKPAAGLESAEPDWATGPARSGGGMGADQPVRLGRKSSARDSVIQVVQIRVKRRAAQRAHREFVSEQRRS